MIHCRAVTTAVFLLAALTSSTALAISPDNHRSVTRSAASVYKYCLAQLGSTDSLDEGMQTIIEFSGQEDISPLLKRYFNWHFFDAYRNDEKNAMGRYFTGARKSLHYVFSERADTLVEALEKRREDAIHEFTGRLLHYIQDVTVPAHVAPIFHYKFLLYDLADYFDEMPEWKTTSYTSIPATCRVTKIKTSGLKQQLNLILDKTAFTTRERIKEPIPVQENHPLSGKTWEEFWVLRNPEDDDKYKETIKGFAPYGKQGKEGFERLCKSSDSGRDACLDFFLRSYRSAVSSTVETLLLVNSVVQRK